MIDMTIEKKQFYRKIIFNSKSCYHFRWNNRLSYERNNSSDYQKKFFETIATIFNMIMTIIFFMNGKKTFKTVEIIDLFMINVPQDFVRLTSWNSIQILFSLRFLFEDFFNVFEKSSVWMTHKFIRKGQTKNKLRFENLKKRIFTKISTQ